MGGVWTCACAGVYQTHCAKSVVVASRTRDRSTCHGGKGSECNVCLVIARAVMERALSSSANSVRTSNIRDHARADQHTHAMNLLKKEQAEASGSGSCSFAPIAGALSYFPDEEKEQLRRKFDIAYFIALEKLS